MKPPLRLLAVLLLGGTVLYSLAGFKRTFQENYLAYMLSGTFAEKDLLVNSNNQPQSVTKKAAFAWRTQTLSNACQLFPPHFQHASALALWTEYIGQIHNASKISAKDPDYEFHDLTAQLLHLISPRLPNSVKAIPRDWTSIQHVLEQILVPRWNYIMAVDGATIKQQQQQQMPPRPVKIVVMGGSVAAGVNCLQIFSRKVQHSISRQQCAWPFRLQNFLDRIMTSSSGGDDTQRLFEVHAVVMGGSNTISGNAILEFDLLPPEAKNPDIIIHAYATNDMHLHTFNQGDEDQSWREKALTALQDFIRLSHDSATGFPCTPPTINTQQAQQARHFPPVVMHLDDYLGNEQREILATTELSQAVHILASYYGTLTAMSYPDVVRDWVYGDTHEFWFSPFGWYPPYKQDKQKMAREIHPGMPAHLVVPWVISYHMLNLLTNYCDRQPFSHDNLLQKQPFESIHPSKTVLDDEYAMARDEKGLPLPALKQTIRFPGRPKVTPYGLPPPLHPDLSLRDISGSWKNQSIITSRSDNELCSSPESLPKCPFAWVSGLLNEHNTLDEGDIDNYFKDQSLEYHNHGWEVKRHVDGKKIGFVPRQEQPGANLTMVFEAAPLSPFRQIILFYLKSYGDRWDESRLQVRIERSKRDRWEHMLSQELVGYHGKNTSEMYVERLVLQQPADRLRLEATFVGGKVFKIMGLLVCR